MLTNEMKAVLAKFDGYSPVYYWAADLFNKDAIYENDNDENFTWEHFAYDTDWNWTMPLYRKVTNNVYKWSI